IPEGIDPRDSQLSKVGNFSTSPAYCATTRRLRRDVDSSTSTSLSFDHDSVRLPFLRRLRRLTPAPAESVRRTTPGTIPKLLIRNGQRSGIRRATGSDMFSNRIALL